MFANGAARVRFRTARQQLRTIGPRGPFELLGVLWGTPWSPGGLPAPPGLSPGHGAEPGPDPRLRTLRALSGIVGAPLLAGAAALFVAPDELGPHWPWDLTPLPARAVAAWYALFATMLLTCAVWLRRPVEALIQYATLAVWSVLLLALPLLYPDDVHGGGLWLALMLVLLALSALGLRVALPDRAAL
jgi:hypothetical protein